MFPVFQNQKFDNVIFLWFSFRFGMNCSIVVNFLLIYEKIYPLSQFQHRSMKTKSKQCDTLATSLPCIGIQQSRTERNDIELGHEVIQWVLRGFLKLHQVCTVPPTLWFQTRYETLLNPSQCWILEFLVMMALLFWK